MPGGLRVIVRAPGPAFARALSTHPERDRIDVERAAAQHRAFVGALRSAGLPLVELAPDPDLPDAPFVSDTLIALPRAPQPEATEKPKDTRSAADTDETCILLVATRPGAVSRRGEVAPVLAAATSLRPDARVVEIEEPGTLDAGDIVVYGDRVAIGVSARTNVCGAGQLALAVQELGYRAYLCPVRDRLHLATAVTAIGPRRLVGTAAGFASLDGAGRDAAPASDVERIVVPDEELPGANVLALSGRCYIAAGNPTTARLLREAGETVVELDLDEFTRADGGPTCLVAVVP